MIEGIFEALFSHASFGKPDGFRLEGPVILVIPCMAAMIIAVIASFVWVCRDAQKRGKNALLAAAFILLAGWPASFLWWLWLRPYLKMEQVRQQT